MKISFTRGQAYTIQWVLFTLILIRGFGWLQFTIAQIWFSCLGLLVFYPRAMAWVESKVVRPMADPPDQGCVSLTLRHDLTLPEGWRLDQEGGGEVTLINQQAEARIQIPTEGMTPSQVANEIHNQLIQFYHD